MKVTLLRHRRIVVVVVHLVLAVVSYALAYELRFDSDVPPDQLTTALRAFPLLFALRALSFWVFRLYAGLWRYVSLWDLNNIIGSVVTSSAVFAAIVLQVWHLQPYPRSVLFIDSVLLICLLGGIRLARRTYREFNRLENERRVLIYGAGDAGEMIVRDIKHNRFYNFDPIGFIDDDPAKRGRFIHGVEVLGSNVDLARIIEREQPHEILIAIARTDAARLRAIVKSLEPFRLPIKTVPNLRDLFDGKIAFNQVRSLSLEDLIMRKPIDLDPEPVRRLVNGRRVLVTGAGGSIGSELSRQLAGFGPARLLLIDRYENSLFDLCNGLARLHPDCPFDPIIADITDAARINRLFGELRPEVVFHAAAHKHVPLMEANAPEAVKNNVRGTRTVAEASAAAGVKEFVLISTDKAVNPSSVMGATKRVAEQLVRAMDRRDGTRFVAVRFGNVLGSNGSASRIFAEQIARGGPVTVTHPEIRRYFMLIPEAVQLVLHAAAAADHNAIYALEMGEPIRIQDLARNLIQLSGFKPDEEIAIRYTGLRPGEKLVEELVDAGESAEPSAVSAIMRVRSTPVDTAELREQIAALERAADAGDTPAVLRLLTQIVPTFRQGDAAPVPPAPSTNEVMPFRRGARSFGV